MALHEFANSIYVIGAAKRTEPQRGKGHDARIVGCLHHIDCNLS